MFVGRHRDDGKFKLSSRSAVQMKFCKYFFHERVIFIFVQQTAIKRLPPACPFVVFYLRANKPLLCHLLIVALLDLGFWRWSSNSARNAHQEHTGPCLNRIRY
tara:strand:+ start:1811 stop:2119 length:309 start_codon:yes stop_codon:yes gene_type:complete